MYFVLQTASIHLFSNFFYLENKLTIMVDFIFMGVFKKIPDF
jgi:hypothetical protein